MPPHVPAASSAIISIALSEEPFRRANAARAAWDAAATCWAVPSSLPGPANSQFFPSSPHRILKHVFRDYPPLFSDRMPPRSTYLRKGWGTVVGCCPSYKLSEGSIAYMFCKNNMYNNILLSDKFAIVF
ncbi:unnamed protein product [Nezara viridula]|uniref:Uncharacterized protein n=1 Tax=Nezara viridula TaxID=85310 RepID=A0A9P0HEE1_NEZVI|nr:unnamed protein product [Nezara viridula]